jgi:hypothetical protein
MTTLFLGSVILGAMLLFIAVVVLLGIASLLEILPLRDREEPVRLEVEGGVSSGRGDRPSGTANLSSR